MKRWWHRIRKAGRHVKVNSEGEQKLSTLILGLAGACFALLIQVTLLQVTNSIDWNLHKNLAVGLFVSAVAIPFLLASYIFSQLAQLRIVRQRIVLTDGPGVIGIMLGLVAIGLCFLDLASDVAKVYAGAVAICFVLLMIDTAMLLKRNEEFEQSQEDDWHYGPE